MDRIVLDKYFLEWTLSFSCNLSILDGMNDQYTVSKMSSITFEWNQHTETSKYLYYDDQSVDYRGGTFQNNRPRRDSDKSNFSNEP